MARILDIYCRECGSKAIITRTERIHSDLSNLYCHCKNVHCGHRFVMRLEFSHTTTTSTFSKNSLLKQVISRLSEQDKEALKKMLSD